MTITRRDFLRYGLMTAASVALGACSRPVEHALVSQFQMPEYLLPGQPLYWATACGECAGGCGLAVKTSDGRAIKMEGIPEHPLSHGRLCARSQAAVQTLYHPNRLNKVTGSATDWEGALKALGAHLGAGNAPLFVTRRLRGSQGGQLIDLAKQAGAKIWILDFPGTLGERKVMKAITGKAELPWYPLEEADYLVTFGGDFLQEGHNVVQNNWTFGNFRQGTDRQRGVMVSVGSRINATVACSDRWLPVKPGTEGWVALAVGNILAAKGKGPWPAWAKSVTLEQAAEASGLEANLITRLAERIHRAKKAVVVADSDAGSYVNGVASQYIIHALGNMLAGGKLPTFEPDLVIGTTDRPAIVSTEEAMAHLNSGSCKAIWIFDDLDPAYVLPPTLKFAEALGKVPNSVAFATMPSATTKLCKLVLPVQTWLESWGDQRISGPVEVYNVQQPVVKSPWGESRATEDILLGLRSTPVQVGGKPAKFFREVVRRGSDDARWMGLLNRGGSYEAERESWDRYPARPSNVPPAVPNPTGALPAGVNPYEAIDAAKVTAWAPAPAAGQGKRLIPFAGMLKDGSYGHVPWLQEMPDPITTVVWGGWIEINSQVAEEMGIKRHDVVKVTAGEVSLEVPAIPLPSVHPDAVAIPVGAESVDYTAWFDNDHGGTVDFGRGSQAYGPYGYTNTGYARPGVNPLKLLNGQYQDGELSLCGTNVTIEKTGRKQMVTAMDLRVFNFPRYILPAE